MQMITTTRAALGPSGSCGEGELSRVPLEPASGRRHDRARALPSIAEISVFSAVVMLSSPEVGGT
jgi:hypothetical protein